MSVNPNYDSDFCGKVPIHFINTVQPYGLLMVVSRPSLEIVQVSENCSAIFDRAVETISGTSAPWREEELTAAETLGSFLYEYATK